MLLQTKIAIGLFIALATLVFPSSVVRGDSAASKAEDVYQDSKKDVKKRGRKVKKAVRDATGNKSVVEDAKDSARNLGDEVDNKVYHVKKKLKKAD